MKTVLFRLEGALDGHTNMARDEALTGDLAEVAVAARLYRWDGPWVSLGKFQSPERDLLAGNTVPWVMRPTGGKAVLHGHDLTLGLAARLNALAEPGEDKAWLERSVRTVYRRLTVPVILAMRACGMPAALGEQTRFAGRGPRTADCFAHVSANDIVDERTGVKTCGVALKVTSEYALIQASFPIEKPLVDPGKVFAHPSRSQPAPWNVDAYPEALIRHLEVWLDRSGSLLAV